MIVWPTNVRGDQDNHQSFATRVFERLYNKILGRVGGCFSWMCGRVCEGWGLRRLLQTPLERVSVDSKERVFQKPLYLLLLYPSQTDSFLRTFLFSWGFFCLLYEGFSSPTSSSEANLRCKIQFDWLIV